MMPLAVAIDLPLKVVPLLVVGYFLGAMAFGGFLRNDLVWEKYEYWDSNLN